MKNLFFFSIQTLLLISCTSKKVEQKVDGPINETPEKISFFPVTSFLKGQLLILDSLPVTILHITTIKNKTDSSWLGRDKVRPYLNEFINQEINETNLISFFKETKFNDQSIEAITYTYTPISTLPDSISIRNWNIYIDQKKSTVTKIFMVKQVKEKDAYLMRQLTWQTNKWATITDILNNKNGDSKVVKEEKFIWDFSEQ